jgi:hypothetical protein
MFQQFMGWSEPLSKRETTDFVLAITTGGTVVVGTAWYFFTSLFYKSSPAADRARTEKFFENLQTPLATQTDSDGAQTTIYKLLGALCLVYGAFILLLTLIPNSLRGRLCFIFVGGVILGVGAILYSVSRRRKKQDGK